MIHQDFFNGKNKYLSSDGKLARQVLRRDYAKFLYENKLDRRFDAQELERAAKAYRGQEHENE